MLMDYFQLILINSSIQPMKTAYPVPSSIPIHSQNQFYNMYIQVQIAYWI